MRNNSTIIRLVGESGEGIVSTGEILSRVLEHTGFRILTFRTYPAEIKGGQCLFQVRFSPQRLLTAGEAIDVLVCFDKTSYDEHGLPHKNFLIYNTDDVELPDSANSYGLPLTSLAREKTGSLQSKNMVALGALTFLLDLDLKDIFHVMERWFAGKNAEVLEKNHQAIMAGREYCAGKNFAPIASVKAHKTAETVILSGNQVLVLGALAAGCRFFAGYPITPASNILEHIVNELPQFGGIGIQTEDEMSALGACIGASYAGTKAMTATSGPGLSLMHELIGLASMMEIPVVIVDAQRAGPSTGMPTKMEQSDLLAAIHGSHGDAPRVVLAPGTVEETFELTLQAFNLSEQLRLPVILLTDLAIAQRTTTLPISIFDNVEVKSRTLKEEKDDQPFLPFELNGSAVNPMVLPGTLGLAHVITGLEHDEKGIPNYTPVTHAAMTKKRFEKLKRVFELYPGYEEFPVDEATAGVISWGSNYGPVLEALELMSENGAALPFLHLKIVHPLPKQAILAFAANVEKILVVENNYQGQLAGLLEAVVQKPVVRITKVDGLPFTASELRHEFAKHVKIGATV